MTCSLRIKSDYTVNHPVVQRVRVQNYKSIEQCDVALGQLTVLVGRNGSGKSNFLDAMQFVKDAIEQSPDQAIKSRGGINAVRRLSTGRPRNFSVMVSLNLSDGRSADYGFEIEPWALSSFSIKWEKVVIRDRSGHANTGYRREGSALVEEQDGTLPPMQATQAMPPVSDDRLYLPNAAGLPAFRPVYDALRSMEFYRLNPEAMTDLQSPDAGELLRSDGSNIASVIARLSADKPLVKARIQDYLGLIVPGIVDVERVPLGPKEALQFRQQVDGATYPWKFFGGSMSEGTLRALGTLVAVLQLADSEVPVNFVGIEEPETALHPAAASVLIDAMREASSHTQIFITSHSPDLLDQFEPETDTLLAVSSAGGTSRIAPLDSASREAISRHLYTPGELLRMDQIEPDADDLARQHRSAGLFDESTARGPR